MRYCKLTECFVQEHFDPKFVTFIRNHGSPRQFCPVEKAVLRNPRAKQIKNVKILGFELRRVFKHNADVKCLAFYNETVDKKTSTKYISLADEWYEKYFMPEEKDRLRIRKANLMVVSDQDLFKILLDDKCKVKGVDYKCGHIKTVRQMAKQINDFEKLEKERGKLEERELKKLRTWKTDLAQFKHSEE